MDTAPLWAEIDLEAIAHNVRELRRITQPQARLMAVVKANGYGHGAIEVSRCALQNGASILGVARIEEGIQIRKAGITVPILVFGYTRPHRAGDLLKYDLTQSVYSVATAWELSEAAVSLAAKIKVHLKVDTGMGRLGLLPQNFHSDNPVKINSDTVTETLTIADLDGLELEGIFTHFASADSADKTYAKYQLDLFLNYLKHLQKAGLCPSLTHAANSGAVMDMPRSHLDIVRPGIAIYGLFPSNEVDRQRISLKSAMALKSQIIQLKKVPAGFNISYGSTYTTRQPTTIATVPIGYADGLNRLLSSRGQMLVGGQRVPIVGRVCMDLTMLDVGNVKDVQAGDEVVVFGQQGNETLTVDEMAETLNTINYEIVTGISARVPRVYL
ncbi:MAG: alanine racemase [Desulfobacterales bacterium]